MSEDKLLDMMEKMMVSLDGSIKQLREDIKRDIEINAEAVRQDIKGVADGVSFLMERVEVIEVDRLQLETRVLKLEAELAALKERLKIA